MSEKVARTSGELGPLRDAGVGLVVRPQAALTTSFSRLASFEVGSTTVTMTP